MPRHFLVVGLGLLLAMGVLSSGCGGSSGTTTTITSAGVQAEDQEGAAVAPDAEPRLRAVMDRFEEDAGTGGVAVAVLRPDGALWAGAAGVVDAATGAEMEPDQPMRVGSVTKPFVAAVVLQLVEEGKLELNDSVVSLWPDFTGDETITVRQLLAHTSGIYNINHCLEDQACLLGMLADAAGISDFGDCQDPACFYDILDEAGLVVTADVLLTRALAEPASFPPGEGEEYSNTGYLVLCEIIESVTGRPAHTELRARLHEPLGLDDTYFNGLENGPPFAPLHGDSTVLDPRENTEVFFCAGAIVSTVEDLAVFGDALWGGSLLEEASLEAMVTSATLKDGTPTGDGLGTVFKVIAGQSAWGHLGGAPGFGAALYHFPEPGVTIAVMFNSGEDHISAKVDEANQRFDAFVADIAEVVMP